MVFTPEELANIAKAQAEWTAATEGTGLNPAKHHVQNETRDREQFSLLAKECFDAWLLLLPPERHPAPLDLEFLRIGVTEMMMREFSHNVAEDAEWDAVLALPEEQRQPDPPGVGDGPPSGRFDWGLPKKVPKPLLRDASGS